MSKQARTAVIAVVLVGVVAACVWFARGRVHFDFANLKVQMRALSWAHVAAGIGLIWLSIALRAPRWRVLLGSASTTGAAKLLGPQFVGFTVVALFGRAADLASGQWIWGPRRSCLRLRWRWRRRTCRTTRSSRRRAKERWC
jgi:hypothetical protein